jgi:hypothetical protein
MRKRIFGKLALAIVLTMGVVVAPTGVMATPSGIVQFDAIAYTPGDDLGSITYDGSTASGSFLPLNSLTLVNVFTDEGYEPLAAPFRYTFDTAGALSIVYDQPSALPFPFDPGTTVLDGAFSSFSISADGELVISGTGLDIKDPRFLDTVFGVDPGTFTANSVYEFDFSLKALPNTFTDDPNDWDVTEASITNHVPEPGTLLLLGLGLAGCGFFRRRKTKA